MVNLRGYLKSGGALLVIFIMTDYAADSGGFRGGGKGGANAPPFGGE